MNTPPRLSALVPAAGMGTRLGHGPKCLLEIQGRSLLDILLATLVPLADEVLVGAPADYLEEVGAIVATRGTVITGGASREATLDILLGQACGDVILIQDAARPFASPGLCRAVADAAAEHGAAGAFLDPMVPVGTLADGQVSHFLSREQAGIFQAPQAFQADLLREALARTRDRNFQSTAQQVISAGFSLRAVPGEQENIKITTPYDWRIAQQVIGPNLDHGHTK